MRAFQRLVRILARLLILVLLGFIAWSAWMRSRPFSHLERGLSDVQVSSDSASVMITRAGERRLQRDVTLTGEKLGPIRITISLPDTGDTDRLPVVLVLGGLEIGRRSLGYISRHGHNALVAYEYPYSPDYWYEGTPIREIPAIQRAVLAVPAEAAAVLKWASEQPWGDPERIVPLGYSFGALFLPAVLRVAERNGTPIRYGVMAYGGADLEELFRTNMRVRPNWWRDVLSYAAATALAPIEPSRHLPHLDVDLLLLSGRHDELIPQASRELMRRLKPDPKTVVILEAGHMHPRKPELTRSIVNASRDWLLERGALNR